MLCSVIFLLILSINAEIRRHRQIHEMDIAWLNGKFKPNILKECLEFYHRAAVMALLRVSFIVRSTTRHLNSIAIIIVFVVGSVD